MAARSGGSRSSASSSRAGAKRSGGAKRTSAGTKRSSGAGRASGGRAASGSGRSDKSLQQFREALERSVTIPRDRIEDVVNDAVSRGRMTRSDANEIVSKLVTRGRRHTDALLRDLERLLDQTRKDFEQRTTAARKDFEQRTSRARRQATQAAGRVGRAARDAADRPLAEADRLRRRAGGPGFPITAYDQLTATQVKSRLSAMTKADLRKVRTREKNGQARKGVLDAIEKRLGA